MCPTIVVGLFLLHPSIASTTVDLPTIEVQVYNRSVVPERTLERGIEHARRAFSRAGIGIGFRRCPIPAKVSAEERCPSGEDVFSIGVINADFRDIGSSVALGFTIRVPGRNNAAVIWPRVKDFARVLDVGPDLLLGFAIAHEVGHLFSFSGNHSAGVMEAIWDRADAMAMAQGAMIFEPEDIERMREQIRRCCVQRVPEKAP